MHAPYQGLGTTARDLAGAYEVFLVSRNKIGQSLAQMVLYFELSCSGGAPSTNENGILWLMVRQAHHERYAISRLMSRV